MSAGKDIRAVPAVTARRYPAVRIPVSTISVFANPSATAGSAATTNAVETAGSARRGASATTQGIATSIATGGARERSAATLTMGGVSAVTMAAGEHAAPSVTIICASS